MYLNKPTKRIVNLGLGLASTGLMVFGFTNYTNNPQSFNASELEAISKAAEDGKTFDRPSKKDAAAVGILQMVIGSGIFAINALVSSGSPVRILPKALDSEDTPIALLPPQPQAESMLKQRMMAVLDGCPQLKKCLSCESLIIIAPAGSGKSSVASAIAFLRAIIKGHKIFICDPHGAINTERGIWLIGKVFESELDIIASAGIVSARRASKAESVTSIFDEFGALCMDKNSASAKFAIDRVGDAIRNNRKFFNYSIFLCHGRDKGNLGGESMPTGYLTAWTTKSAVLELEADYNDESEAVFSGRARFKPPGTAFDDDDSYERFVIPEFLNPIAIRQEFADLFHHLRIKGAAIEKTAQKEAPDWIDQEDFDRNLETARKHLIGCYDMDAVNGVEGQLTDGLTIEQYDIQSEACNRVAWDEEPIQKKLLFYYFDRKPEQLDDGWLSIRTTGKSWARHNDLKDSELKVLLSEMQKVYLVEVGEKGWKPRVPKNDLILED